MGKYSFKKFIKECSPMLILAIGIITGIIVGIAASVPHTEKHGCEYVEKTECKQVWVRK